MTRSPQSRDPVVCSRRCQHTKPSSFWPPPSSCAQQPRLFHCISSSGALTSCKGSADRARTWAGLGTNPGLCSLASLQDWWGQALQNHSPCRGRPFSSRNSVGAAGVLRAQSETRSGLGAQTMNQGWGSSQVNDSTDRPPAVLGCGRADEAPQFLSRAYPCNSPFKSQLLQKVFPRAGPEPLPLPVYPQMSGLPTHAVL